MINRGWGSVLSEDTRIHLGKSVANAMVVINQGQYLA